MKRLLFIREIHKKKVCRMRKIMCLKMLNIRALFSLHWGRGRGGIVPRRGEWPLVGLLHSTEGAVLPYQPLSRQPTTAAGFPAPHSYSHISHAVQYMSAIYLRIAIKDGRDTGGEKSILATPIFCSPRYVSTLLYNAISLL